MLFDLKAYQYMIKVHIIQKRYTILNVLLYKNMSTFNTLYKTIYLLGTVAFVTYCLKFNI